MLLFALILSVTLPFSCKNKVNEQDAAGTIGKVEKYRKDQMKGSDIILRSEIMEDTAKLESTINGMVVYSAFSQTLASKINTQVEELGYCGCYESELELLALKDFSEFISNNEPLMENTIGMLVDFYNDDVSEVSFDVETNLRNFANYVNQLDEKSMVLDEVIGGMDEYIAENLNVEEKSEKIDQLKGIRDELMLRNIQSAVVIGNQDKLNQIASSGSLFNSDVLGIVISAAEGLNYNIGEEVLSAYNSTGELNGVLQSIMSQGGLGVFICDIDVISNIEQLSGTPVLTGYEGLNAVLGAGSGIAAAGQLNDGEVAAGMEVLSEIRPMALEELSAALNSSLNSFVGFNSELNSMEGLNVIRPQ